MLVIYHPTSFNKSLVGVILMVIPVFLWARTGTCFCAHHAACGKSHKMTAAVLNNKKATTLIIPTMTSQAVLRLFYTTWIPFMEIEWYCWYLWLCLYKSDNMSKSLSSIYTAQYFLYCLYWPMVDFFSDWLSLLCTSVGFLAQNFPGHLEVWG